MRECTAPKADVQPHAFLSTGIGALRLCFSLLSLPLSLYLSLSSLIEDERERERERGTETERDKERRERKAPPGSPGGAQVVPRWWPVGALAMIWRSSALLTPGHHQGATRASPRHLQRTTRAPPAHHQGTSRALGTSSAPPGHHQDTTRHHQGIARASVGNLVAPFSPQGSVHLDFVSLFSLSLSLSISLSLFLDRR